MSAKGVRLTTATVGVGAIRGARRLVAGGESVGLAAKYQCSRIAAR
jgi:hypothetical protein